MSAQVWLKRLAATNKHRAIWRSPGACFGNKELRRHGMNILKWMTSWSRWPWAKNLALRMATRTLLSVWSIVHGQSVWCPRVTRYLLRLSVNMASNALCSYIRWHTQDCIQKEMVTEMVTDRGRSDQDDLCTISVRLYITYLNCIITHIIDQ